MHHMTRNDFDMLLDDLYKAISNKRARRDNRTNLNRSTPFWNKNLFNNSRHQFFRIKTSIFVSILEMS